MKSTLNELVGGFSFLTPQLGSISMRSGINCLIDSITDPFSTECWLKYVGQYQKMSVEEKLPLMHDVTYREAQTMFIDHVHQVVFVDHEIITLQGLLRE